MMPANLVAMKLLISHALDGGVGSGSCHGVGTSGREGGGGVWCKGKNTYDTLTSIQVLTRGRLHKPISMSSATRFKILASASEVTFFTPARSTSRRRFDSCMLDLDMSEQDSAMACGERHRSREALVSKRCGLAGITFRRSASKAHLHVLCARSGMPASDRHR